MNRAPLLASLHLAALAMTVLSLSATAPAQAQLTEDLIPAKHDFISPEHFVLELRVGPFSPNNDRFQYFLGEDLGPMLELELSVIAFKVEDILDLTIGGAFGYAGFKDAARNRDTGERLNEQTELDLIPLSAIAAVRLDALPRLLSVPLIFTAKIGYAWLFWDTSTGAREGDGQLSHGLRWGAQVALDLDIFEPSTARALDEEWGINHSFLFFEFWGFKTVGDTLEDDSDGADFKLDDVTWSMGLGFNF